MYIFFLQIFSKVFIVSYKLEFIEKDDLCVPWKLERPTFLILANDSIGKKAVGST